MANEEYCVNDGKPMFSKSVEHGNEPLCAQCYKDWLANRDVFELHQLEERQAMLKAKIEARQKIATGGKK